jgi:hypothetical protein
LRTALDTGLEASASLIASDFVSHISRAIIVPCDEPIPQSFHLPVEKLSPEKVELPDVDECSALLFLISFL